MNNVNNENLEKFINEKLIDFKKKDRFTKLFVLGVDRNKFTEQRIFLNLKEDRDYHVIYFKIFNLLLFYDQQFYFKKSIKSTDNCKFKILNHACKHSWKYFVFTFLIQDLNVELDADKN